MKASALALLVVTSVVGQAHAENPTRYLALQIFTSAFDGDEMRQANFPPIKDLHKTVLDLREKIGAPAADGRHIGFVFGPISLDDSEDKARRLIADGFALALETVWPSAFISMIRCSGACARN